MKKVDKILEILESGQEEERLGILNEICNAPEEEVRPCLYRAMGDSSWRVRKEATEIFLSRPAPERFAGEVARLLYEHDNAGQRNAAVEILVRLGQPVLPLLFKEVLSDEQDVRKFVLDILGEIGDGSCLQTMIDALADADQNVRQAAAENLGKLGLPEAVPHLVDVMDTADLWFRYTILDALGRIGAPVDVKKLLPLQEEPLLRKALFECLGRVGGADAVASLAGGLGDEMRTVREAAAVALESLSQRISHDAFSSLRPEGGAAAALDPGELLGSGDPRVRLAAVRLMGLLGDERHSRRLLELADDEELREEAARALVALGPDAARALLPAWDGLESFARVMTAYTVGETGCREGTAVLLKGLSDDDQDVRAISARALGKLDDPASFAGLLTALEDPSDEVRESALQSLSLLGASFPAQTVTALKDLLEHDDPSLRTLAVRVLGRLEGEEIDGFLALAIKDHSQTVRRAAICALEGKPIAGHLPVLMLALTDEDKEVRRLAAEVLGSAGDIQASRPLELALQDEDPWVRTAAVRSLGLLGAQAPVPVIEKALHDPVGLVVIAALETLAVLDFEKYSLHFVHALGHEDVEVVNAALKMLGERGFRDWISASLDGLLNHRHREVRSTFIRILGFLEGPASRPHLERRLRVEDDDLVQAEIRDFLAQWPISQG
ncbi:HEAT repeat domain-containing protein [uncultured Desulfuromonas sp.]|mgnify:CR=1 FL=1|uniref:HEAT repeat domain-containing protein n=1 Tax=uncultured Desulfuromonas sp. TaxID=181013 RepID=UPI0026391A5C|nr:HEAT repeat domain-containing protein [uncultured Desulfuromonas sp.]